MMLLVARKTLTKWCQWWYTINPHKQTFDSFQKKSSKSSTSQVMWILNFWSQFIQYCPWPPWSPANHYNQIVLNWQTHSTVYLFYYCKWLNQYYHNLAGILLTKNCPHITTTYLFIFLPISLLMFYYSRPDISGWV